MPPKPTLPRPTHFLCLPLVTPSSRPQLQSSLSIFKADVSAPPSHDQQNTNQFRIPEKAIRPPGTLHLTINVMNLDTAEKLNGAIQILNSIFDEDDENQNRSRNINTNPPSQSTTPPFRTLLPLPLLTLKSLYSMHTPHSTSILYTSPSDPNKHLQTFCESLKEKFTNAGFVLPERGGRERGLLLHATIVNTVYVPRGHERPERGDMRGDKEEGGSFLGTGGERGIGEEGAGEERASKSHTEAEEQNPTENKTKTKTKTKNTQNTKQPGNPPPAKNPPKPNARTTRPNKQKARLTFDARAILSRYADFTWMRDVRIEKVAICRMGAKKRGDGDEEYEVEAEVEVPWV
ncbi:hypothetical protein OCU04_009061 [Sclerotinia nivalis]|uniref:A-kinase anchor protein 7-like phosphoesterase domain-containing protein n=1 Tax=Sclerotinia nivalis TaxID=352851 RepID=A0A9X0AKC2_9HELO|nr:hypothetical protein OCU04_009061 [Sclerotinia nivalis]